MLGCKAFVFLLVATILSINPSALASLAGICFSVLYAFWNASEAVSIPLRFLNIVKIRLSTACNSAAFACNTSAFPTSLVQAIWTIVLLFSSASMISPAIRTVAAALIATPILRVITFAGLATRASYIANPVLTSPP